MLSTGSRPRAWTAVRQRRYPSPSYTHSDHSGPAFWPGRQVTGWREKTLQGSIHKPACAKPKLLKGKQVCQHARGQGASSECFFAAALPSLLTPSTASLLPYGATSSTLMFPIIITTTEFSYATEQAPGPVCRRCGLHCKHRGSGRTNLYQHPHRWHQRGLLPDWRGLVAGLQHGH
ncbi:hypothetical protein D3C77_436570 [compost metagenome]